MHLCIPLYFRQNTEMTGNSWDQISWLVKLNKNIIRISGCSPCNKTMEIRNKKMTRTDIDSSDCHSEMTRKKSTKGHHFDIYFFYSRVKCVKQRMLQKRDRERHPFHLSNVRQV